MKSKIPFVKCPRCELNYMLATEKMCSVCARDVQGDWDQDESITFCSECGENPVVPGNDLCEKCLKERAMQLNEDGDEDLSVGADGYDVRNDDASGMNEFVNPNEEDIEKIDSSQNFDDFNDDDDEDIEDDEFEGFHEESIDDLRNGDY